MNRDHIEVLDTLHRTGLISRQAMKTIRGQLFGMIDQDRELYLRRIISKKGERLREQRSGRGGKAS